MSGARSAPYEVRLERRVVKEVASFEPKVRRQIGETLERLRSNARPHDSRSLRGVKATFRIDVGEYRILYEIDHGARLVTVWKVAHRKDVYRNL